MGWDRIGGGFPVLGRGRMGLDFGLRFMDDGWGGIILLKRTCDWIGFGWDSVGYGMG